MSSKLGRGVLTRRRTIQLAGATLVGLAGCIGGSAADDESAPDPVDLSGGKFDYQGGMEIGTHGGPNGQVFYTDNDPDPQQGAGNRGTNEANLAWFHTLAYGLFPYHFDRLDRGWEPEVIYVTDYSSVDWKDGRRMPSPTAPASFGDATELTYVVESDAVGGMGPDLFPFATTGEAESFAEQYDGRTVTFEDIDRKLVGEIRNNGDTSM